MCIIISPVFAYEYQTGADAVVLSSKYGRRKTVWAKLIAGFTVTSRIYFIAVLVSLISVLVVFGVQGWKQSSRSMTTDMFIGLVRKYTRARKLTSRMLNELIEKLEVFNAEKINGVWEQRLRIHYNCVVTIEIPTVLPLPIPEVSVNTRKGVVVNYAPCELAV